MLEVTPVVQGHTSSVLWRRNSSRALSDPKTMSVTTQVRCLSIETLTLHKIAIGGLCMKL